MAEEEEEGAPLASAPVAVRDFEDFCASQPDLATLLARRRAEGALLVFERCCLRRGLELAGDLEAELCERLRGIRFLCCMLVGRCCEEPCDWCGVRREVHDFRGYEAMTQDPVFLMDADAEDVESRCVWWSS